MNFFFRAAMLLFPLIAFSGTSLDNSNFFNTKLLRNVSELKKELLDQGFKQIAIETFDKKTLTGYMRQVKNPQFTVIAFNGINLNLMGGHSDLSELAFLTAMLPQDCNILLVNKRGIDGSQGSQLTHINPASALELMGHDVRSALESAHTYDQGPKILFGVCYGAFFVAHTYIHLPEVERKKLNIVGLVLDSGWTSLKRMVEDGIVARFDGMTRSSYFNKKLTNGTLFLYSKLLKKKVDKIEETFSIKNDISKIDIPVLIIHSEDDPLAKIDMATSMIRQLPTSTSLIFPPGASGHGIHFLKQKHAYSNAVNSFCTSVITPKNNFAEKIKIFSAMPRPAMTSIGLRRV